MAIGKVESKSGKKCSDAGELPQVASWCARWRMSPAFGVMLRADNRRSGDAAEVVSKSGQAFCIEHWVFTWHKRMSKLSR